MADDRGGQRWTPEEDAILVDLLEKVIKEHIWSVVKVDGRLVSRTSYGVQYHALMLVSPCVPIFLPLSVSAFPSTSTVRLLPAVVPRLMVCSTVEAGYWQNCAQEAEEQGAVSNNTRWDAVARSN